MDRGESILRHIAHWRSQQTYR